MALPNQVCVCVCVAAIGRIGPAVTHRCAFDSVADSVSTSSLITRCAGRSKNGYRHTHGFLPCCLCLSVCLCVSPCDCVQ